MVVNVQLSSLYHLLLAKNFSISFQGNFNEGLVKKKKPFFSSPKYNRLVPNWESSTLRLYTVTLLI